MSARPRSRRETGFTVVFRSASLVGYQCRECGEEFGRDQDEPAPTVCPRVDRHKRAGPRPKREDRRA